MHVLALQIPPPINLVWLGLVGIADPPRQGLRELLCDFRTAGLRPVMLTGDQRPTARAVGEALCLNGDGKLEVLDSSRFADGSEMAEQVGRVHVFARVSPAQKLQIVRAFQRAGKVVAMTGDGINDGPALKAADVGIALGQGGTRVAAEVADIVLADDNVNAILPAIAEGRRVHANARKAIRYIAGTNLGEIFVVLASLAAGGGTPLNPRQLLWINLITDVFPELALALGPGDADLMRRPPEDPRRPVIGRPEVGLLARQAGVMSGFALACYAIGAARYGVGARASSMAFLSLSSAQLLHGFLANAEGASTRAAPENPMLVKAVLFGIATLLLSQFGLGALLGTVRIGVLDALVCASASAASYVANRALRQGGEIC